MFQICFQLPVLKNFCAIASNTAIKVLPVVCPNATDEQTKIYDILPCATPSQL